MDNFLYGLIAGAVCVTVPAFVRGFVLEWRKDVAQKDYKEFTDSLDEFDHWYASYGNTPEYKAQFKYQDYTMKLGEKNDRPRADHKIKDSVA